MRLLIVNSNTSSGITDLLRSEAEAAARPDTIISTATASYGPPAIETPDHVAVAAAATADAMTARTDAIDAAVIACFSDPGLGAIRRAVAYPVVGLAEAAMFAACMLGSRFSIVTVAPQSVPGIRAVAARYGLTGRLAGVHALHRGVLESHADPAATARSLAELARRATAEDRSDVVVLGGAVTAGMARSISPRVDVPVVDGLAAAVLLAESLVALRRLAVRSSP